MAQRLQIILSTIPCLTCVSARADVLVEESTERDRQAIAAKVPPAKPEDVSPVGDRSLCEVRLQGGTFVYVTRDGHYLIAGDLFDLDLKLNLSEVKRNSIRKQELASVYDKDSIIFDAQGDPKHTITVFTDPDCTYCRKFHSELQQITALGIRVRYLAFPRTGPGTDTWTKSEAIWCARDRQLAITRAKLGEVITSPQCESPIGKQFELGERIGVRGTPMIVADSGAVLGGYLPANMLPKNSMGWLRRVNQTP